MFNTAASWALAELGLGDNRVGGVAGNPAVILSHLKLCVLLQSLFQMALMFKNSSKLGLAELGLGDNRIGGVAGQCLLRALQAYAASAPAGMFVDTKNCSTGSLEP